MPYLRFTAKCRRRAPAAGMLAALLLAVLAVRPAAAQVRGRVVDAAERPVAGAVVELWVDSRPAGAAETDAGGEFRIAGMATDSGVVLTVRRMGMRPRTVPLGPADTVLVVRMEARPVVLQPLAVAADRRPPCPNREDPRARELWERMRARYWQPDADSVFVFGFVEWRTGVGARTDVFDPRAGRVTAGWTTGALIVAHPPYMRLSGYANSAAGGVGERTAYWSYRDLDGGTMQDFTGEYFGEAHTLSVVHRSPEGTTIAFCPRARMGRTGQVLGTLVLAADTTLQAAAWRFRTPRPDEDAGGEASFEPPDPALGNALLARESVFWRKTNPPRYWFQATTFTGWQRWTRARPVLHPEDARPAAGESGDLR